MYMASHYSFPYEGKLHGRHAVEVLIQFHFRSYVGMYVAGVRTLHISLHMHSVLFLGAVTVMYRLVAHCSTPARLRGETTTNVWSGQGFLGTVDV